MTISSQEELRITQARIAGLEQALALARRRLATEPTSLQALVTSNQRQLDELQSEIREFLGIEKSRPAAYEIRFGVTEGSNRGSAPMSSLEKIVRGFRGAMTAMAEVLSTGEAREFGRPPVDIARLVDFRVVGMAPGSVRLLLEPPLQRGLPQEDIAAKAFEILEETASWVESAEPGPPVALEDPKIRTLALRQVQRLAPSEWDQVAWVEMSGPRRQLRSPTRLTPALYHRVSRLLEQPTEKAVEVRGKLREIDLDEAAFEIRIHKGRGGRLRCVFPVELVGEALAHIASQATVVVRGRQRGRTLTVSSLRLADSR